MPLWLNTGIILSLQQQNKGQLLHLCSWDAGGVTLGGNKQVTTAGFLEHLVFRETKKRTNDTSQSVCWRTWSLWLVGRTQRAILDKQQKLHKYQSILVIINYFLKKRNNLQLKPWSYSKWQGVTYFWVKSCYWTSWRKYLASARRHKKLLWWRLFSCVIKL